MVGEDGSFETSGWRVNFQPPRAAVENDAGYLIRMDAVKRPADITHASVLFPMIEPTAVNSIHT